MTTIAYRNGIMAGDRRVTNHNIIEPDVTKIFKRDSDGALIGAAGTLGLATRFTRWFLAGEKGEPPELFDKDGGCEAEAIIVRPNCHPETHYRYGVIHLESDYYAIGSGSCAALTALDLGFSAIEAVDAAARRDTGTGPKHDVLHLGAAISALTPPLQHKGGETEVGGLEHHERFPAGKAGRDYESGLVDGATYLGERSEDRTPAYLDGLSAGQQVRDAQEGDPLADAMLDIAVEDGLAFVDQPISTLQASSGEGETIPEGFTAWTGYATDGPIYDVGGYQRVVVLYQNGETSTPGLRCAFDWAQARGEYNIVAFRIVEPTDTPTEPAAYSPVNNADEPVTKPEADVFYHGLQAEAEAKKDPVSKLFGAGGFFGKPKALVGEGA